MARKSSSIVRYLPAATRAAAPVIRIAAPRAIAPRREKHPKRRRGGAGGNTKDVIMKVALGAAAVGFIEKSGTALPTVPMLGRKGTIAAAAYFFGGKKPGLARDIAIAAAALAAYEFAKEGKVSGDDD